ncbi:DsbA family oxidoreductase [Paenibacillus mesophilus]|uniref:DsbA family oxidoreductase n=1 Tax=Paenibacillus mesophilus TaxID=2582849 RepID=UPI00110D6A73|nr:DsbA family oxidoreductase [Paenibacillus mesophilus]TMV48912.1 DsbA family oxidoreductase [Paenibacillus mesophilus]
MKVEIWSDFVCPFCYIGKRRFESALEQFPHRNEVEIVYRSFELDPNSKRDLPGDIHDMLASKYGMSREKAMAMNFNVGEQAQSVGLTYHFDMMKPTNTFDAHRLAHFAGRYGKSAEMTERLLQAYFTEGKHIGDHETLTALAAELGLDRDEVAAMLSGEEGKTEVRSDEQEASALGVRGVPFFVFNRKYAISGAQPTELFADTLNKVWSEAHPLVFVNGADGESADVCEDGVCGVPPTPEHKS